MASSSSTLSLSPASSAAMRSDSRSPRGEARRSAMSVAEVVGEGVPGGGATLPHLRVRREQDGVETSRDIESPVPESVAVLDGNAEHLADDDDGQGVRELLDQVHRVPALDAREEAVHDALDVRAQPLHHARGERLAHEAAEPRMVRRVAIQHRKAAGRGWRAKARGDEGRERFLAEAADPAAPPPRRRTGSAPRTRAGCGERDPRRAGDDRSGRDPRRTPGPSG